MARNKSFIRWAGGKSWFVEGVQNLVRNLEFNNYIEPFMGGASIFFSLDIPHQAYLSDINDELVNTFIQIRDNLDEVIAELQRYPNSRDDYYQIRDEEPDDLIIRAARFLYLNFYSFNGIYRVNRAGKYNVPYGNRTGKFNYNRMRDVSEKLQHVNINCNDFDMTRNVINAGDLVFLDPPYTVANNSVNNDYYISYNATLFSLEDQRRLRELINYINDQGAYYILTNAHHDIIAEIFNNGDRRLEYRRHSHIGGRNARREVVQEYIFTNIPEINREEDYDV